MSCHSEQKQSSETSIHTTTTPAPPVAEVCLFVATEVKGREGHLFDSYLTSEAEPMGLDPMDWLMLVAFENRKVFQNRIQDLVGSNTFLELSWVLKIYSWYDPRRGGFKMFFHVQIWQGFFVRGWCLTRWHHWLEVWMTLRSRGTGQISRRQVDWLEVILYCYELGAVFFRDEWPPEKLASWGNVISSVKALTSVWEIQIFLCIGEVGMPSRLGI